MFAKPVVGTFLGVALLASGCQSSNQDRTAVSDPSTQALMCSQCKTTFVKVRRHGKAGQLFGYRTREVMTCPECKTIATGFFNTGKVHSCSICGDSIEVCEAHEAS